MKVLQFAFGSGPENPYLPHNYERGYVVYTGTHDNDTTRGWFATADEYLRHAVRLYLGTDARDVAWDLIRVALASVANWAIVPLQDVLDLGRGARMNTPGQLGGNWAWRYESGHLTTALAERLAGLTEMYGRTPAREEPEEENEAVFAAEHPAEQE
jgi:4-alpha-glucanotransferase